MVNCVLVEDFEMDEYLQAALIDAWVEEHLDECSIILYYETQGDIEYRLYMAVFNNKIIDVIKLGIECQKEL